MSSELGVAQDKIQDLSNYATSALYSDKERKALEYADAMTRTDLEVSDALFEQLKGFFSSDELVELTATIAWENCSSKFNRALRIDSQGLWQQTLKKLGKE